MADAASAAAFPVWRVAVPVPLARLFDYRPPDGHAPPATAIGKRVQVVFQPLDGEVALPQFALSDEPPQGRVWRYTE